MRSQTRFAILQKWFTAVFFSGAIRKLQKHFEREAARELAVLGWASSKEQKQMASMRG